jgi:hypothetical protein
MVHSFEISEAKKYGIECAVLLFNIRFWVEKNKANGKHFYDGKYWTYNSYKAFQELFPYMSEFQIKRSIQKLESVGEVISGNYNDNTFDRAKWYSLPEKTTYSNGQNCPMEETELSNGTDKIVQSFIGTDINTDINADESESRSKVLKHKFFIDRTPNRELVGFDSVEKFMCEKFQIAFEQLKIKYKDYKTRLADFESQNLQKTWKDEQDFRSHVVNFCNKWQYKNPDLFGKGQTTSTSTPKFYDGSEEIF